MTPTQQIIPAPRLPDVRHAGRASSIELAHPAAGNQPRHEAAVNYSALLRRHRTAVAIIVGGTLLLSVLYTLVAHKVYQSEAILEVMGINQDFMNSKDVDPTSSQLTGGRIHRDANQAADRARPSCNGRRSCWVPEFPAAIAAGQDLFGKIREMGRQTRRGHPGGGRSRGVEDAGRRQGQGRWIFGSDYR